MGIVGVVLFAVAGLALLNGMPHFVAGSAGLVFRTPFGRYSSARTNVVWGMANFVIAIGLLFGRTAVVGPTSGDIVWFVVGALVSILLFAFRAADFFDDRPDHPADGSRESADSV
ncbi:MULTISPECIES: hypothetical protein [unclassified Curtobacterium]|uniref:hypothetical protein n=1 Tax=unclassified Curtobacterium TaxID=257496 RepID=UPI003816BB88